MDMESILTMYKDATGTVYDGDFHGMDLDLDVGLDRPPMHDSESDIDEEVVFHDDDDAAWDEDNDTDNTATTTADWTPVDPTHPLPPPALQPCTNSMEQGPIDPLPPTATPFDFFSLFFDESMFELMAEQTNLYALQQQDKAGKEDKGWKDVTPADMKVYISITIMMGIHVLPQYAMYWSKDDRLRVPGIADAMGKSRYEKITQYLHLNDMSRAVPRGEDDHDPLFKVRPIIENFRTRASAVYVPGPNISIDEAMIEFNGRLHFKQYIPAKPTPWGIKVWCCADPQNGYMLDINVYTGKANNPMPHGVGHHVVMNIGKKFLDKFHHFYFDNFFSSVQLAEDLLARNTYSCSTIRVNRKGWPKALNTAATSKMERGEIRAQSKGSLLATVFNDKRKVSVLSTNQPSTTSTVERRVKGGVHQVAIPTAVLNYNNNMLGVDLADQLRSYYAVGRSGVKWWRYILWFIIQLSITNAWNLYRATHRPHPRNARSISHLKFRLDLCSALSKGNVAKGKRKAPLLTVSTAGRGSTLSSDHQAVTLVRRKGACFWCSKVGSKTKGGRTRETVTGCSICKVHLHKGMCFASFHQELASEQ